MKYVGSKHRHAKHILPIILKDRKPNDWYVEPFVGSCGTMDKVTGPRIGNDNNYYLIEMWKALQNGWKPPEQVSLEEYKHIRDNKNLYFPELIGFVGFGCSFGGKWWGGYARGKDNNGKERDYCGESRRNVLKQVPLIKDIIFTCKDYRELTYPTNSIIYLDPPYANTTKYSTTDFDYVEFWEIVRDLSKHHTVFVSEYIAPNDFECVWSKEVNNTLNLDTGEKKGIEKLFKMK